MYKFQKLDWLKLPDINEFRRKSQLLYGADYILSSFTFRKFLPTGIYGAWVHGCSLPWQHITPAALIYGNIYNVKSTNWVVKKEDKEYLIENGFKAEAIGLPICYLPQKDYTRRSGSLLIMPSHSSFFVSAYSKDNDPQKTLYLNYLEGLLSNFDVKVACVHHECIKRGLWLSEFEEIDIPVIQGASTFDLNSLERIQALMCQFEFVTSNIMGSNIAYAAAFGAKVSIAGPYHKHYRDEFMQDPFLKDNIHIFDYLEEEEELARSNFPFLFVEPQNASQHIDWGMEMIGMENKKTPSELIRLLRIDPLSEINRRTIRGVRSLAKRSLELVGLRNR